MPAKSKAQQRFMGMEYAKAKKGLKPDIDMSEKQLKEFAGTKTKGLPAHVSGGRKGGPRASR